MYQVLLSSMLQLTIIIVRIESITNDNLVPEAICCCLQG